MLRVNNQRKSSLLWLSVGLGLIAVALIGLFILAGRPVRAQSPDGEDIPPEKMAQLRAMDIYPLADAQLPLRISVNYTHDLIEEGYPAGHTVWITVTNPTSDVVKATAEMPTEIIPWFIGENQEGFSTDNGDPWMPARPDIQPGDWVLARSSEGYTTTMQVGDITGYIDVAADTVTGTVWAPWLLPEEPEKSEDVEVKCKVYEPLTGAYTQEFDEPLRSTMPDGEDTYTCDFTRDGWDVRPGQLVAISYDPQEPGTRSNRTVVVVPVPGPYLQVKKWAQGSPGAGGNIAMTVEVRNQGPVDATGVTLTDQMVGMTYLDDTSGFPVSGSGAGPITWDLDTVPAGEASVFEVFARVTGAAGTQISDTVTVASSPADNMGFNTERTDTWTATVDDAAAWLSVSQGARTRNPVPGTQTIYVTNVCNTGNRFAADSTPATLTVTLPITTSLVEWWAEADGWEEVGSTANELILRRPTLSSHDCSAVYTRVTLDAATPVASELCATAAVNADNNVTSAGAQDIFCHIVGEPRANLSLDKTWAAGQLVPGSSLAYEIGLANTGNTPVDGPITLTDTLPVSTTFDAATATPDTSFPFDPAPVSDTGTEVVWEIPAGETLHPGDWITFRVALTLADDVAAGTALTNTVTVAAPGLTETDTADNTATWVEEVGGPGPNLRLRKASAWSDRGMLTNRLAYRIEVENVGDEAVYDVTLTDTYDSRMRIDGRVHTDVWDDAPITYLTDPRRFTVDLDGLDPGEAFVVDFATLPDPFAPLAAGLTFENTAEVSAPIGDIAPDDNTATATNVTGPDLTLSKAAVAGTLEAGQPITYELAFGNAPDDDGAWWDLQSSAQLVDTLPPELTYVSSSLWLCEGTLWCELSPAVAGQGITWDLGALQAGEWNIIRLIARIVDTATEGTLLTNTAEIAPADTATDVETDLTNNTASAAVTVGGTIAPPPTPPPTPPPGTLSIRMFLPVVVRSAAP